MARAATAAEEKRLTTEQTLSAEAMGESFPSIEVRIVYLGMHPHKTERVKGTMLMETVGQRLQADEPNPEASTIVHLNKRKSDAGYTDYDFAAVDNKGRRRRDGWTADGKRFVLVEHLDHILYFFRLRDDRDGTPIYEVRGEPDALEVVKRYRDLKKGTRVNPDQGAAVLKDMKDVVGD
jgi:hypothetical protein